MGTALAALEQHYRFAGDAFFASYKAQLLCGGSFDADLSEGALEVLRDASAHLLFVGLELRGLGHDRDVDISDDKPLLFDPVVGIAQELATIDT